MASSSSVGSSTTLIPLPPPPAEAFTRTGYPRAAAAPLTSARPVIATLSSVGTPAWFISRFDVSLEPMASIDPGEGPIQMRPASTTALANPEFSARNP